MKNKKNKNIIVLIVLILTVLISTIILAYFYYQKYSNRILPNIFINEENYSNLTEKEALNKLENNLKDFRENGIVFSHKDIIYEAELSELGIEINTKKIISEAFLYGHQDDFLINLKDYFKLKNNKINFQISPQINKQKLKMYLLENISQIETPPENFQYKYKENEFIPIPAKSGMIINQNNLTKEIFKNIINYQNKTIEINLIQKNPEVTEDKNKKALFTAQNLLTKKIILTSNDDDWEIQKEDFASWIKFQTIKNKEEETILGLNADKEKIKSYLLTLVPQINREPINAQLEAENGKVNLFFLSKEGIALQIEENINKIENIIFQEKNYYEKETQEEILIEMITKKVQPEITTKNIDNMGITSLLATGESNFYGSPRNRRHNITVGAGKFQGILIGPEDKFSFNKVLGNVGPREGYLPELVIKKGETVPEYGGGLCQVSTTAFRAAVLAGLEITERKNHAYAVQYYNPQGTDATIYPPHPDLQFTNNTPAYILIQTRIIGNKLFFDFYGLDDGRIVKTKGPVTYDRKSDGSMKSVWTQQVYDENEELLFEKKFYSIYKSPNLYPHKSPLE
ncbi:MAG: VanW family protein [Methanosarcinaceae archaeon]